MAAAPDAQAAEKVFAVPELLEMVLCNLGMKTLFRVQRVSKTFQGAIEGSQKLQRIMLLTPSSRPKRYHPMLFGGGLRLSKDVHMNAYLQSGRVRLVCVLTKDAKTAMRLLAKIEPQSWLKTMFTSTARPMEPFNVYRKTILNGWPIVAEEVEVGKPSTCTLEDAVACLIDELGKVA